MNSNLLSFGYQKIYAFVKSRMMQIICQADSNRYFISRAWRTDKSHRLDKTSIRFAHVIENIWSLTKAFKLVFVQLKREKDVYSKTILLVILQSFSFLVFSPPPSLPLLLPLFHPLGVCPLPAFQKEEISLRHLLLKSNSANSEYVTLKYGL